MKVLVVSDAATREEIENTSIQTDPTNVIKFTQDGADQWFVTERVVNDPSHSSVRSQLLEVGVWVDYTPFSE